LPAIFDLKMCNVLGNAKGIRWENIPDNKFFFGKVIVEKRTETNDHTQIKDSLKFLIIWHFSNKQFHVFIKQTL
jgi:hypothetical protein